MPSNMARSGGNLATGAFNPEHWSLKLNSKFYAQNSLMDICNTDWQGEVVGSGTINIRNIPDMVVSDYVIGKPMAYADINDTMLQLHINKAKYWNVIRDDIDKIQQDIDLFTVLTISGGHFMKNSVEKDVFASVYGDAGNVMAQTALDKTNVVDWIIDGEVIMEENNLPDDSGRWIVVSPRIGGLIQKSDLKDAAMTGDAKSIARVGMGNGRLGMIGGVMVYISNHLEKINGVTQCIAGHKKAITYAAQITKVEKERVPGQFAESLASLVVYGFRTTNASALISMPATT